MSTTARPPISQVDNIGNRASGNAQLSAFRDSIGENKANSASGNAHQVNLRDLYVYQKYGPSILTRWRKLDSKKKWLLFCLIFATAAIVGITPPVYLHYHDKSSSAPIAPSPSPTTKPNISSSGLSHIASSSSLHPAVSRTTVASIPSPTADGIHLMNSRDSKNDIGSGVAWYASAEGGNKGVQPDDYTIESQGDFAEWEGHNRTTTFTHTNTPFWSLINSSNVSVNATAGRAGNGFRDFDCYRDDGRVLFRQNETDFYSIYFCQ